MSISRRQAHTSTHLEPAGCIALGSLPTLPSLRLITRTPLGLERFAKYPSLAHFSLPLVSCSITLAVHSLPPSPLFLLSCNLQIKISFGHAKRHFFLLPSFLFLPQTSPALVELARMKRCSDSFLPSFSDSRRSTAALPPPMVGSAFFPISDMN